MGITDGQSRVFTFQREDTTRGEKENTELLLTVIFS